jgi:hypothetical protein
VARPELTRPHRIGRGGSSAAFTLCFFSTWWTACDNPYPAGLARSEPGPGPAVVFDLDAKPLPEIPFPTDLAARTDATSPTGLRINISTEAPTGIERRVRSEANHVDGFSTYGPISVRFTAPLDIENLVRRHRRNRDFADDAVLLVYLGGVERGSTVSPGTRRLGDLVPLDLGHGNFPLTVPRENAYWDNDPRRSVPNLLFDTTNEDTNQNGVLDRGEDTDSDGFLDAPNVHPAGGDRVDDLLSFYERSTNTLIVRPVIPLEQASRYAVVLLKTLRGADGNPVRSPFPFIHHARHAEHLRELPEALLRNGFSIRDAAFVWTFTTQSTTRDLEALRRGLYGHGAFARLAREFPPDLHVAQSVDRNAQNLFVVPTQKLKDVFPLAQQFLFGGDSPGVRALLASYDSIDYFIAGDVTGPNLLADRDGLASPGYPSDDDEIWEIDRKLGMAYYRPHKIPFLCSIPRKDRGSGPPFPVAIYAHGYTSSRFEMLGFAGNIARYGIATCVIDAYGHGLGIPKEAQSIVDEIFAAFDVKGLQRALIPGRARDLDNDGVPDSGGDFFTADLFHTRDTVRQSVLDQMVLIRALRACDGSRKSPQDFNADGRVELACDFDADGVPDMGGPRADFFAWGQSLGGILSSTLAGIEPAITAAAPSSGGGGLGDIALRSTQGGIPEAAILRTLGPLVVGEPSSMASGTVDVSMIVASVNNEAKRLVARGLPIAQGDRVVLENLVNGEAYETYATEGGRFRAHIPADAFDATTKRARLSLALPVADGVALPRLADTRAVGDALRVRVFDAQDGRPKRTLDTFEQEVSFEGTIYGVGQPLVALARGWGFQRNTPRFRRFLGLAQIALDAGDPINYAPHYFRDPLLSSDYDTAEPGANVCVIVTAGDTAVPAATGVAIARAAGIVDVFNVDHRYGKTPNEVLIDNFIIEGLSRLRRFGGRAVVMDPENFSRGRDGTNAPRLDPPLRLSVETGRGVSALRIPLGSPGGQHAFGIAEPDRPFDLNTFLVHMVGRYFQTRGRELRDDECMATASCDFIPRAATPLSQ